MGNREFSFPPDFYNQINHNKLRCASWHDYLSPSFYMVTLTKRESDVLPLFSEIIVNGDTVAVNFSWSGWAIHNAFQEFASEYHYVKVGRYVIMPDHVHFIVQVTVKTAEPLGFYVNKFKAIVSQSLKVKSRLYASSLSDEPVFENGFNDRILMRREHLDVWSNYVKDNPRRLWLMRSNPDYFRRSYVFTRICPAYIWNMRSSANDPTLAPHRFPTFGNAQLLRYPEKIEVRFSRSFSEGEWEAKKREILRVAENGGVLVSPAIHKEERLIVNEGIMLGARVIRVIGYGFPPREKPQGADFGHCAEGRMLLFALNEYEPGVKRDVISRVLCERMNACAKWIVGTNF